MIDPLGPVDANEPQQPPLPGLDDWQKSWAGPYPSATTNQTGYGAVAATQSGFRPELIAGAALLLVGGLIAGAGIGHEVWRPGLGLVDRITATATGNSSATSGATKPGSVIDAIVDINTNLGYQGAQAAGTGIVLTTNGTVLTNNHVINGATDISVTDIGNGQTYKATVAGYDKSHDLAVLHLQGASGLTTAPLGDSSKVSVGDAIVGIGNAGGAGGQPSQAAGSVTGLDQSITASDEDGSNAEPLSGLIHVDAAIVPGDSGGPLVNSSGQVVGIDTAGSTSNSPSIEQASMASGGGDGFAIPINEALSVAQKIEQGHGSSTIHLGQTPFLGVQVAPSADNGGSEFGLGTSTVAGAQVEGVVPDTAAAQAGLTAGDVITAVNGKSIDSPASLNSVMAGLRAGDSVTVAWTDQAGASQSAHANLTAGPAA